MTLISFEDSIRQCDFKFQEICDVTEKNMSYGRDSFFVTLSSVIWDIKFISSNNIKPIGI